jgi:hypothetical protein
VGLLPLSVVAVSAGLQLLRKCAVAGVVAACVTAVRIVTCD